MKKYKLLFMGMLILLIAAGCSQSIDKKIIGTWENMDENDDCDTDMDEKITFDDEGMVVGIEGFKNYKVKEADNKDYDYTILSGGIEDSARYRIKFDEDDSLHIVYEEDDTYDFESAIACHMEKVSD